MPVSVTPVLSNKIGFLTDIRDQVVHVIQFMVNNPGRVSDIWEDDLISLRYLSGLYGDNREKMAAECKNFIENILGRKFKDYSFNVEVTPSDYIENTDDGRYKLTFDIMIIDPDNHDNLIPAIVSGSMEVDSKRNELIVHFSEDIDSTTI